MKNVKLPIKILIILIAFFMIGLVSGKLNTTYAASTSYDINAIDESKYPGYKSALQSLQAQYPNWKIKLLYTGLDWNEVIENEYTGHLSSPKNLIYDTYTGEWICPICGYTK